MEQIGVCAGGYQTANKAVLEHIARPAGILADDDSGGAVRAGAALQLGVVPAEKTPDLESVVSGKIAVGFSPEAVGSKIFSHIFLLTILTISICLISPVLPRRLNSIL